MRLCYLIRHMTHKQLLICMCIFIKKTYVELATITYILLT